MARAGDVNILPEMEFGCHFREAGVEFRLFSRHATAATLLLYDPANPAGPPTRTVPMARQGDVWSIVVPGLTAGTPYAFRVHGPFAPEDGHRFDAEIPLLDPYGRATTAFVDPQPSESAFQGHPTARARSVALPDRDLRTPSPAIEFKDLVIYETHLRGLTAHPSSQASAPGTYEGFQEKLSYLADLGVNAIELLPIHEYDPLEYPRRHPTTGARLGNYWGYSSIGFFAPHGGYARSPSPGAAVEEFAALVAEIHRHGMKVVLDVVYNHTAEGHQAGPTINFKGLDNAIYYHLGEDRSLYTDFTGCGNSLKCNHPVGRRMIVDSLRYFATRFGVDGFRFDLATVLCRNNEGGVAHHAPLIEEIGEDPYLRNCMLIAEPWDAAGGYMVGHFPGRRFGEWNGRYRDEVRQFWRGDAHRSGRLATRLMGSSDLYAPSGRPPWHSVNFVTSHDGFTLADLVSYNRKHNIDNAEENRDGENHNYSFNCGVEGPTDDPKIDALRLRMCQNFLGTLLLSQGVPMITAGDEFRRTQRGNNNAYCQDNDVGWVDWRLLEKNRTLYEFTRNLIWFRRRHPAFRRSGFFTGRPRPNRSIPDAAWFDADGRPKDWHHDDHTLMCHLDGAPPAGCCDPVDDEMLLLFHAGPEPRRFTLAGGDDETREWRLVFDTGNPNLAGSFTEAGALRVAPGARYPMVERSLAVFMRPVG